MYNAVLLNTIGICLLAIVQTQASVTPECHIGNHMPSVPCFDGDSNPRPPSSRAYTLSVRLRCRWSISLFWQKLVDKLAVNIFPPSYTPVCDNVNSTYCSNELNDTEPQESNKSFLMLHGNDGGLVSLAIVFYKAHV